MEIWISSHFGVISKRLADESIDSIRAGLLRARSCVKPVFTRVFELAASPGLTQTHTASSPFPLLRSGGEGFIFLGHLPGVALCLWMRVSLTPGYSRCTRFGVMFWQG